MVVTDVEPDRLAPLAPPAPLGLLDQRFFDTPYYVAPNEPIPRGHAPHGHVALGRLVLAKRERVIALEPYGKGLLGTTLRYPYEVRDAKDYFADLPELALAPDKLALATQILESKLADFDPKAFPRPLRGGAARAPESQTGRCGAGGKANISGPELHTRAPIAA